MAVKNSAGDELVRDIRTSAVPVGDDITGYDPLLKQAGNARFVLIGEATHGTENFYRIRAEITKKLVTDYGFDAVAVEADWPDSYRVNRYVRGVASDIPDADSALGDFVRFPTWMWRNTVVRNFVEWLRDHNDRIALPNKHVGLYGLDIYSLHASIQAVIRYLEKIDPPAAMRARHHYSCFGTFAQEPQQYGYAAVLGLAPSCEEQVIQQLIALRHRAFDYTARNGFVANEDYFAAEQNAKVVIGAEAYYRTMFKGRVSSWNLRDTHMSETLQSLAAHVSDMRSEQAKIIVWAHNSHIGDARATELGESGEVNIGQLTREHAGHEAFLIGFSTFTGTVRAASEWDGEDEVKPVNPGTTESYEKLFHDTGLPSFLLFPRTNETLAEHLNLNRLQRAIGVIYLPESERMSHYFFARLTQQFDAMIHIDETTALQPLARVPVTPAREVFETYPTGI